MKFKAKILKFRLIFNQNQSREAVIRVLKLQENDVKNFEILHCAIVPVFTKPPDLLCLSCPFRLPTSDPQQKISEINHENQTEIITAQDRKKETVLIAGTGPGGLFAALRLIEYGFAPILLERGRDLEESYPRCQTILGRRTAEYRIEYSIRFGWCRHFFRRETSQQNQKSADPIFGERFVEFGADPSVLYMGKPHLGTDILRKIIANMKHYIETQGGRNPL
jgi:uncharacterized FAD-dependent dehydrogenase